MKPAAEGDRGAQQRGARRGAEPGGQHRPSAAHRDEDARDGEDGRRDRQPETGDFKHGEPLPELGQILRRQHRDLGVRDGDAVRQRHVVIGESTIDLLGDRREVDRHGAVAVAAQRSHHGVVRGPVRRLPGRAERRCPGERACRVPHEVVHLPLERRPHVDFAQDPLRDGPGDRLPDVGVGGERLHRGLVAPAVADPVHRPGRQRAERREQTGEQDQDGRQGAADTRGHPTRQGRAGAGRERCDGIWAHTTAERDPPNDGTELPIDRTATVRNSPSTLRSPVIPRPTPPQVEGSPERVFPGSGEKEAPGT